ncbi:MAG: transcription termination/antitermination protein NusG [Verrucomicrobiales bacterium]
MDRPLHEPVSRLLSEPAWFCLRSRTKAEHLAAVQVARHEGVEVFCPRLRFRRNTRRGPVWFVEALFPGYFFARFSPNLQLRDILHTQGVTGIIEFGDRPTEVGDADIAALRGLMNTEDLRVLDDSISEGTATEVVTGPFRGIEVVVTRILPSRDRVRILLEFLGGMREIEVSSVQLASPKPIPKPFRK